VVTDPLPPFSVSSGSAAVKLSQEVHFPSSLLLIVADSLLDWGESSAELELEISSTELELGTCCELDEVDATDDFPSVAELDRLALAELDELLSASELSVAIASVLDAESSVQLIRAAIISELRQKARARFLIYWNIPNFFILSIG
jgi:hypothetical protein